MGGRGAFMDYKSSASSGIIILAGIIKTKIGKQRDSLNEKVSKALDPSYKKEIIDKTTGRKVTIKVETTNSGNGHIANDILSYRVVGQRIVHELDRLFKESSYYDDKGKIHSRNDNREHFFYFKHPKKKLYFHVARKVEVKRNGRKRYTYELYSITKDLGFLK